jgi:hypothetical protein
MQGEFSPAPFQSLPQRGMPPMDSPEKIHYLLTRQIIDTGHAPTLPQLADLAGLTGADTERLLKALEQTHGVILIPNSLRIWSLHPFALNPTIFWVSTGTRGWWANCAWCSLGIGAALRQDVTISTADGGEAGSLEFSIEKGQASQKGLVMNFPYPPARWWDNPFAPCASILFFSSERRIHSWSSRHAFPRGSVLPIDTAIRLAELWFGDYASADWVRKTSERANEIFSELDLDRSFWTLPASFR